MSLLDNYSELDRRQKILVWVVIAVIIFTSVLAYVLLSSKPVATGPVIDNTPVTLRWRKLFYNQNDLGEIISGFQQKYPNVTIQLETVSQQEYEGYTKKLIRDFSINNPPDIFSLNNSELPAMSRYMAPIEYFKGDKLAAYQQDFIPLVVRETMQLNSVYAISTYVDNLQMYYNTDILSQSGIPLPAKTWDELVKQAKIINKKNSLNQFVQSAISLGTANNVTREKEILPILIMQRDGIIYDYKSSAVGLGQPRNTNFSSSSLAQQKSQQFKLDETNTDNPTVDAVRFYTEFANPLSSFYSWNRQEENSEDAFLNGKTAYIIHYSYFANQIRNRNPNLKFDVSSLPQSNDANKKTYGNYFMDGISSSLNNVNDPAIKRKRQAAEAFLVYLSTKDVQKNFNAKTLTPPARKDIINDIKTQNSNQFTRVFAEGSLYSDNYYQPRRTTNQIWFNLVEDMQTKSTPLSEAVTSAVNEYQRFVSLGADVEI